MADAQHQRGRVMTRIVSDSDPRRVVAEVNGELYVRDTYRTEGYWRWLGQDGTPCARAGLSVEHRLETAMKERGHS